VTGQTLNGTTVNGTTRPAVRTLGAVTPIFIGGIAPADQPQPATTPADTAPMPEPAYDPVKLAEADRIRKLAEAEATARRIEAEGKADAERTLAAGQAEELRIANERKRMRLEKDQADHAAHLAKKAKETADADTAKSSADKAAADEKAKETARSAEQQRTESWWKWGARGIYAVGLAIAAPVQFLDFWDKRRPFLVTAPALLEGFALVLACGAAWAVAHRRDVRPYRVGIMLGASIAAAINLRGGLTNPAIGLNAGIIGAIASLGGPIVLMAYEHGIAQKADGIPSRRETRAADKKARAEQDARDKARADREAAAQKAAEEKKARDDAAEAEQKRRDDDRQQSHEDVWTVADALRSARGSATVTEQIWAEAWLRVTGSKLVGVRPEMEAQSKAAHDRMKAALDGSLPQVESHRPSGAAKAPDAPDGRMFNGGTPPRRRPGDSAPPSPIARTQARLERTADATTRTAREDS
jgi:hypothetical protein